MTLDYIELLTIRSSLVYTQKKNKVLNFDCLLRKIDAMLGMEEEKPKSPGKRAIAKEIIE